MDILMNGVTVLNEVVRPVNGTDDLIFSIFYFIVGLVFLLFSIKLFINKDIIAGIIFSLSTIVIIFCSLSLFYNYTNGPYYKEYKITIDKNVKYKEFTDKFNIINQDKEIYTVTLKENK